MESLSKYAILELTLFTPVALDGVAPLKCNTNNTMIAAAKTPLIIQAVDFIV
jgi:hypothetical protein